MNIAIAPILDAISNFLWPFIRIAAVVMAMPVLGGSFTPARVKILLALALMAIIVMMILMTFNVVFWACFEQAGSSLTLADNGAVSLTAENDAVIITNAGGLSFAIGTGPAHGVLTGTPPAVTYTPTANHATASTTARPPVGGAAPSTVPPRGARTSIQSAATTITHSVAGHLFSIRSR